MAIVINKLIIELFQEASNEMGSEQAEIIVNPCDIGLYDKQGKCCYFYTFKSEAGFSFNDKEEIEELFDKIGSIVGQCKI